MTKEEKSAYNKKHYEANKERIRKQQEQYQQTSGYKKSVEKYQREYHKIYQKENKDRLNEYRRNHPEWYKNRRADPAIKLMMNLRVRQGAVLKGKQSTTKGLGCTKEFLKEYIESQFTEGMSWDNYGVGEGQWSLDHKLPLDLIRTNPELTPQMIHYTNLQPMWHADNVKKGKKIIKNKVAWY